MGKSEINWCDKTWNVTGGCSHCSEGCRNCWAEKLTATRFKGNPRYDDLIKDGHWTGKVKLFEDRLDQPLRWRDPCWIFVNSQSDLFHEKVPFEFITRVFDIMCTWRWPTKAMEREGDESNLVDPKHTYYILTKRLERISDWLEWVGEHWPGDSPFNIAMEVHCKIPEHILLGVSVENQQTADERIPLLLKIPATHRFLSVEPMLEQIDLPFGYSSIDWAIIGAESGNQHRPCNLEWISRIVRQLQFSNIPVFIKQLEINGKVSHDMSEWPEDLQIQQLPVATL